MKRVLPEAITKPELTVKFNDAMYIAVKAMEYYGHNIEGWKRDHGYLEGK